MSKSTAIVRRGKGRKKKSAPDRHAFSLLLGLIVGTCGFYAHRAATAKNATA